MSARPLHAPATTSGKSRVTPARTTRHAPGPSCWRCASTVAAFAAQPRFHRLREGFGPGVRVAVHGAYLVFHTLRDDDRVVIERVVHGARDLGSLLDG